MFKKKGLIFYFVLISLLLHLLAALEMRRIPWMQAIKRLKEPIAIDIIGTPKHGKETAIPKYPEKPPSKGPAVVEAKPRKEPPREPLEARAAPVMPVRPSPAPSRTSRPTPAPAPAPSRPAPAPLAAQVPAPSSQGEVPVSRPAPAGKPSEQVPDTTAAARTAPGSATPQSPGATGTDNAPRRLVQPTVEDLMRYAKVDKNVKRVEPDQGITLDTDDLKYTSYMQGLKRRIEAVWKYPETARQDGISGELVMRFSIAKSGRVDDIEVLRSSGYSTLDKAAQQALMDASPFNPLPNSWNKDRFVITGTFVYRLYGLYVH